MLTLLLPTAALAQLAGDEVTVTLDIQNVSVADVIRTVETIVARPILGGDIDPSVTVTLLSPQIARRDVIPLTSFALGLVGLTIVETSKSELRVEAARADIDGSCGRGPVDLEGLAAVLSAGDSRRVSFEFVDAPAIDVLRMLPRELHGTVAFSHVKKAPTGSLTLASHGPLERSEAVRLLLGAVEREGNALLQGPSGSFAVVGCASERPPALSPTERLHVLGTLIGASALALIDLRAQGEQIWHYGPGDRLPDRVTEVAAIEPDGVVLRGPEGCVRLAVGERGEGRAVTCPARLPAAPSISRDRRDARRQLED